MEGSERLDTKHPPNTLSESEVTSLTMEGRAVIKDRETP